MLRFWLAASVLCGCLVYPLMRVMPLNKHIYSASFTLAAIAICGVMVTLFVLLIDMLPLRCPRLAKIVLLVCSPLKWLGLNPLAIFVLMDLVGILMIRYILLGEDGKSLWTLFYETCFANWIENQEIASTVFACFFVVFWVAVAGLMYRFKLFFKLWIQSRMVDVFDWCGWFGRLT